MGLLAVTSPREAAACTRIGGDWTYNVVYYSINANDFAAGFLTGLSLTANQARFWIQWASSQWKERTDANMLMVYAGDTTAKGVLCGGVSDGQNEIDVTSLNCINPPSCSWRAATTAYFNSNNDIVEADICVAGARNSWAITTPIPGNSIDLVGALVHEFGHFAGIDHTPNTVMNSTYLSGTRTRYPYGDDIDCSYVKWGSINGTRYISKMPPQPASAFSAPQQVGGGSDAHFNSTGAVGADNSGQAWFVSGALHPNFNYLRFTRAQHPVNNNPTWQGSLISGRSRRPPSVASRPVADSVHVWGAAWTVEQQTVSANGIKIAASSDMFQTTSSITTLGAGSWLVPQEPALFYDSNTQRWGMLFVQSDNTLNDELFAKTSLDLVNWTADQDLGFQTLDAPSASCVPLGYCTAT